MIIQLLILFPFSLALAQEVDCPPEKELPKALLEKISTPSSGFKYKGYISFEEMNEKTSRELAEQLVQEIHVSCDEARGAKEGKSLEEDSDVMMYVTPGDLIKIEKDGFQENKNFSSMGEAFEIKHAESLSGRLLAPSENAKYLKPKYAVLNVKKKENVMDGDKVFGYSGGGYGLPAKKNIAMVFKPSVKKRTTWLPQNSLFEQPFRGSRVANTLKYIDTKDPSFQCNGSCEAQIWGKLDFSDVDYVILQEGTPIPEEIKKSGIAVYKASPSETSEKLQKGELLLAADPTKFTSSTESVKTIPKASSDLIKAYKESFNKEEKKSLINQLGTINSEEVKKTILENFNLANDASLRSSMIMGLAQHGKDSAVRAKLLSFLKYKYEVVEKESWYGLSPDLLTSLIVVASSEGFKDDKDLREILEKISEKNSALKESYDRFFLNSPICPEYKSKE